MRTDFLSLSRASYIMFAEEPTMIKKAAALLVILATLGIASEASARPTCTIQRTFDGSYH
jgi:hypothetical protein